MRRLEECQNLLTDGGIVAYTQVALGEPAFENVRVVTDSQDHAEDDLGGQFFVGTVEGQGSNRIAAMGGLFLRNPSFSSPVQYTPMRRQMVENRDPFITSTRGHDPLLHHNAAAL